MTSIGNEAFRDCSGLTEVVIGPSVTSIGTNAFNGCSGLKRSAYPNTLKDDPLGVGIRIKYNPYDAIAEDGWIYGAEKKSIRFAPNINGECIVPSTIESISNYAFYGCEGLTSVIIPPSVTEIGNDSFSGCNNLVKSAYPNSISANPFPSGVAIRYPAKTSLIVDGVIYNTRQYILYFVPIALTEFTVPETVKYIEDNAFYGCDGMITLKVEPTTPPSVTRESFDDEMYSQTTLFVPEGSESAYQSASIWDLFYNIETYDPNAEEPEVGINNVETSENEPVEVYNLNGVKVGESLNGLPKGIYIVRQGAKTSKVAI